MTAQELQAFVDRVRDLQQRASDVSIELLWILTDLMQAQGCVEPPPQDEDDGA